jgi:hypothetical protein
LVEAAKSGGRWHYSTLKVTVAGWQATIDILTEK